MIHRFPPIFPSGVCSGEIFLHRVAAAISAPCLVQGLCRQQQMAFRQYHCISCYLSR